MTDIQFLAIMFNIGFWGGMICWRLDAIVRNQEQRNRIPNL